MRVYLACSQNGLTPCVEGHSAGEVADLLGAINVAGRSTRQHAAVDPRRDPRLGAGRRDRGESERAAAASRATPAWQTSRRSLRGECTRRRALPFNWGPRPPSVNRVAGLIWLAYALPRRAFDAEFFDDVRSLFATFYHVTPSTEQLRALTLESN